MITLYTTPLSANGRKVQAAALQLHLDLAIRHVNVYAGEGRTPEYLQINPTGKIPTLVDHDLVLSESNAILIYLAEAHGSFQLFSDIPAERAAITKWLFWESAHWQPALSSVLSGIVGHLLLPQQIAEPETPPNWADAQLRPLLVRLDEHLRDLSFLAGERPTIADFSVGGMTTYFRAARFPFSEYPSLSAWHARLEELDGWRATAVDPWSTGRRLASHLKCNTR